jgi:hypothetical protein
VSECLNCKNSPGDDLECQKESKVEEFCDNYDPKSVIFCGNCKNQDDKAKNGCIVIADDDECFDTGDLELPVTKATNLYICTDYSPKEKPRHILPLSSRLFAWALAFFVCSLLLGFEPFSLAICIGGMLLEIEKAVL